MSSISTAQKLQCYYFCGVLDYTYKFKNETHGIFQLFILEKKATQTCQDFRNILYFFMILQLFDGVS